MPVDGLGPGIATVRRAAGGSCRLWPRKRTGDRRPTIDWRGPWLAAVPHSVTLYFSNCCYLAFLFASLCTNFSPDSARATPTCKTSWLTYTHHMPPTPPPPPAGQASEVPPLLPAAEITPPAPPSPPTTCVPTTTQRPASVRRPTAAKPAGPPPRGAGEAPGDADAPCACTGEHAAADERAVPVRDHRGRQRCGCRMCLCCLLRRGRRKERQGAC